MILLNQVKEEIMKIAILLMLAVLAISFKEDARLDRELADSAPAKVIIIAGGR